MVRWLLNGCACRHPAVKSCLVAIFACCAVSAVGVLMVSLSVVANAAPNTGNGWLILVLPACFSLCGLMIATGGIPDECEYIGWAREAVGLPKRPSAKYKPVPPPDMGR